MSIASNNQSRDNPIAQANVACHAVWIPMAWASIYEAMVPTPSIRY